MCKLTIFGFKKKCKHISEYNLTSKVLFFIYTSITVTFNIIFRLFHTQEHFKPYYINVCLSISLYVRLALG